MDNSTEVGKIHFSLDLDNSKFKQGLNEAKGVANSVGDGMQAAKAGSFALLGGLTLATAGAVSFGIKSVEAFKESQTAVTQLEAVLKSTGGAAGVTEQHVLDLSDKFLQMSGVSDEAATSMQSMLLTFTNIGADVFDQTAQSVLDMATAMNGGATPSAEQLRGQAVMLGKALQDPDNGLGALHRVGVNTDELSKKFTANMSIQEKQKLILAELGTEFGHSAEMAGSTFGGQLSIAKENFGNLMETIGEGIVTSLGPLVTSFNKWFESVGGSEGVMRMLEEKFRQIQPFIPLIAGAIIGGLVPAVYALTVAFVGLMIPLLPFMIIGAAVAGLAWLIYSNWGTITNFFTSTVPNAFATAWGAVSNFFMVQIPNAIMTVMVWFTQLPQNIGFAIGAMLRSIIDGFQVAANFMLNVVPNAVLGVINWYNQLPGRIANAIANAYYNAVAWFNNIINAGHNAGANTVNGFVASLNALPGRVSGIIQNAINTVMNAGGALYNAALRMADNFWQGFKRGLGIKSPSYIEKAFMAIGSQSKQTLGQLKTDMSSFNNFAGGLTGGGTALLAGGSTANDNSLTTNFNGPIHIYSPADADSTMATLSRNQELARKGLTTERPNG